MKNALPVLLLALLVAGGAYLALGGSGDEPVSGADTGSIATVDDVPPPEPWQSDIDLDPDDDPDWNDDDEIGEPDRTALATPVDGTPRPGPQLKVVVPLPRGQVVAGAEVFWVELRAAIAANADVPFMHPAELAVRHGKKTLADATGTVELPPVQERLIVAARHEGKFGTRTFDRRHRKVEYVVLVPDQQLVIQVLEDEKPRANVPIEVFQRRRDNPRRPWDDFMDVETDDAGKATIPHFQIHRTSARRGGRQFFLAMLNVPLLRPVLQAFRDDPIPKEPVVLRLPPTGSVAVRVVGQDGRPFPNAAQVTLVTQGRQLDKGFPLRGEFDNIIDRKGRSEDRIVFPFVGLGVQMMARVRLDDDDFTWNGTPFQGPAAAGQRVEVDVLLPDWIGLLSGRLLDPDGRPYANAQPTFLITGRAGRIEGERLPTGPDGRFELPYKLNKQVGPYALEVRDQGDEGPMGTLAALRSLENGRRQELGDLQLDGFPAIARGVVVNDIGAPVEGAQVVLQRLRDLGGSPPRLRWREEAFVETRTAEDGTFALYGTPLPGRLRLEVDARGHFDHTTPDLIVGGNVEVRLIRSGSLNGVVRIPGWLPPRALQVQLLSAVEPGQSRDARVDSRGSSVARYRFWNLRPGVYDFVARIRQFPEPLMRIDGVRIDPGRNQLDPRLARVDLRSMVFRYRLRAIEFDGRPIKDPGAPVIARVVRPNGATEFVGFPWRNGRTEIFSTSPRLDIVQLGVGRRPFETTLASGNHDLRFEQLQPVQLTLPGLRAAVGPRKVRVSMVLRGETGLPSSMRAVDQRTGADQSYSRAQLSKSSGAWLAETDVVRVPLARDGKYAVVVRIYEDGVRGNASKVIGDFDIRLDAIDFQRILVPVDMKKVEQALADLRARKSQ